MNRDRFHTDLTASDVSAGRVFSSVSGDVRGIDRDMAKAEATGERLTRSLRGAAVAGAAVVAAGAGIGRVIGNSLDFADAIDKGAIATGLGAENLQRYTFAGEQMGIQNEFLIDSFSRFNKRLNEVALTGKGPGSAGFEALGISQKFVSGELKNTDEALAFALDRLAEYETSGERAALAAHLFGSRAGPEMAKLLAGGSQVLEDWRDRAAVVSDDVILKSVEIADEWAAMTHRMEVSFKGFVLETVTGWAEIVSVLSGDVFGRSTDSLKGDLAEVGRDIAQTRLRLRDLEGRGPFAAEEAGRLRETLSAMREKQDLLDGELQRRSALKELKEDLAAGIGGGSGGSGFSGGGSSKSLADEEEKARQKAADQLDALIAKQADWADAKRFELSLIGKDQVATKAANDEREISARLTERWLLAIDAGRDDGEEYRQFLEQLADEERDLARAIREKSAAHEEEARAAEAAARANEDMAAALANTFSTIRSGKDLLFNLGSIGINALFGQGAFGSVGNSLFGVESGGITGLFNRDGNAFTASGVTPFKNGGVFDGPTLFQYGSGNLGVMAEEEPEAVMPLRRDGAGRLGVASTPPVVNVKIETHTSRPVQARTYQEGGDLRVEIMEVVADGIAQVGSPVDQALNARGV